MSSVHLTVGAPAEIDDDASRVILDGAVHLWVETYGRPEGGDVLTVLWCGPRDYPPAAGAPHGHLDAPEGWNAVAGLSVIVTDDAEARDHGLAWCELERL